MATKTPPHGSAETGNTRQTQGMSAGGGLSLGGAGGIPGRSWFDQYSIRAQWAPVLAVVAPAAFSMFVAFPDLASTKSLAAVAFVGLPPSLAQTARNMGKRLEPGLWAKWGGKPTVRLLRHRDGIVAEPTKARYFDYLLHEIGLVRPTSQQEAEDPASADGVYQSAADWLMRLSRDPKVGALVASKNAAYGLARNLLGVRWVGFLTAALSAAAMAALAWHRWPTDGSGPGP